MHDEVRKTLKHILQSIVSVPPLPIPETEPYLVWKRSDTGGWTGVYEERPSRFGQSPIDPSDLDTHSSELGAVITRHHPNYSGLIGCSSLGSWSFNPRWYLPRMASELFSRHAGVSVPEHAVDSIVDEFAQIIDKPTVTFDFIAPLSNFHADKDLHGIELSNGMSINRLTEGEVTELYGGYVGPSVGWHDSRGIDEFAIVGSFDDEVILGERHAAEPFARVVRSLDRVVLGLRTFQTGPVGYDRIRLCSRRLFGLGVTTRTFGHEHIPSGRYHLISTDATLLPQHIELLSGGLHPTIEMACSRLGDAEIRFKPSDRILDAVIGLEAILLAETSERYRGELRYRFSLNYATLFETPEHRIRAFRCAKDLYDLRSKVAHAGRLGSDHFRLGDEQLGETEAAKRSCEMLRFVIMRFLQFGNRPPHVREGYWVCRLFGLPDEQNSLVDK